MLDIGNNLIVENTVKIRKGLPVTSHKLTKQTCKIAYLGASVTAQKTGYRPFLHEWFIDYFNQPHVEINAGIGGIVSRSAVFLMDDHVIKHKPDICFLEYTTADMGKGYEVGAVVDGIVRKLLRINCEVCFLYLYKKDQFFNISENQTLAEYEEVADFYQIPSINVGKYLDKSFNEKKLEFSNLFRDNVHTYNDGSKITSNYIAEALKTIVSNNYCAHTTEGSNLIVKQLHSESYEDTKIIYLEPRMFKDAKNYTKGEFQHVYLLSN